MPANHCKPHTAETKLKMSLAHRGIPLFHKRRPSKTVNGVVLWRCCRCEGFFPLGGFYKNKRTILGIKTECKKCHTYLAMATRDKVKAKASKVVSEGNRRAKMAGVRGVISARDLAELKKKFGSECLACGSKKSLTWDHVIPISKKGMHCITNLQCLCRKCNEKKQAVHITDYRTATQIKWVIQFKKI